jgi:plasmid stabilization system protein ParE
VFEVQLLSDAEKELSDAFDWYQEQKLGLGIRFYNEVDYYLNLLEKNPYLFPVKYTQEIRAVSLNKFPYLIIYWIDDLDLKVMVLSIFHTSRHPKTF